MQYLPGLSSEILKTSANSSCIDNFIEQNPIIYPILLLVTVITIVSMLYTVCKLYSSVNTRRLIFWQEEYAAGDEIGRLHCLHRYHVACVEQWLRLKNWCPICKASAEPSTA